MGARSEKEGKARTEQKFEKRERTEGKNKEKLKRQRRNSTPERSLFNIGWASLSKLLAVFAQRLVTTTWSSLKVRREHMKNESTKDMKFGCIQTSRIRLCHAKCLIIKEKEEF